MDIFFPCVLILWIISKEMHACSWANDNYNHPEKLLIFSCGVSCSLKCVPVKLLTKLFFSTKMKSTIFTILMLKCPMSLSVLISLELGNVYKVLLYSSQLIMFMTTCLDSRVILCFSDLITRKQKYEWVNKTP